MKHLTVWSVVLFGLLVGCEGTSVLGGTTSDGGGMDAVGVDVSCPTGQRVCGGRCTDPSVDPTNCGACGVACTAAQACVAGACELRCPGTQAVCAGQCTNLQTDGARSACPGSAARTRLPRTPGRRCTRPRTRRNSSGRRSGRCSGRRTRAGRSDSSRRRPPRRCRRRRTGGRPGWTSLRSRPATRTGRPTRR